MKFKINKNDIYNLSGLRPVPISAFEEYSSNFDNRIFVSEKILIDFNKKFLQLIQANINYDNLSNNKVYEELESDFEELNQIREENLKTIINENEKFLDILNNKLKIVEIEINKILQEIKENGEATKPLLDELEIYNNELNQLELEMKKRGEEIDAKAAKLNSKFYSKVDEIQNKVDSEQNKKFILDN